MLILKFLNTFFIKTPWKTDFVRHRAGNRGIFEISRIEVVEAYVTLKLSEVILERYRWPFLDFVLI